MATPVQGRDGKFAGSVGSGKGKVPTPGRPVPSSSVLAAGEAEAPRYADQHARLSAGQEEAAAGQVAAAQAAVTPAMLPRPRPVAAPAEREAREPVTPGGYVLTGHLLRQAAKKGIPVRDLEACLDFPSTTYASHRYPGQVKHIRGVLCVAVEQASKRAVTVFLDRVETDLRADQRGDADALAWDRKRRRAAG